MRVFLLSLLFIFSVSLFGENISKSKCDTMGKDFIFAGGECIQYYSAGGDIENAINIIVHGTWKEGTNTLGRYAPFADKMAMMTDITTIAVALPGYSKSSSNHLKALIHKSEDKPQAAREEYIKFLRDLISALKEKYSAKKVTYIGHSAGAMMGATLAGYSPNLVDNMVCAGGRYDIHEENKDKDLISIIDYINKVPKTTHFLLIYGTEDKISKPEVTKNFYKTAKEKGLDVTPVEAKGAPHLDLDMTDTSVEAIVTLLESQGE